MTEVKGYEPSEEEMKDAEGHLTESEKHLSDKRPFSVGFWDVEKQKASAQAKGGDTRRHIVEEEKRGEVIELPISIMVKVPKDRIFHGQDIENCAYVAEQDVLPEVVRQMNEKYPEMVADSKEYADNQNELYAMYDDVLKGSHTGGARYEKSESYDLERARELIKRNTELQAKYGIQYEDRYIREKIEALGDQL